VRCGRDSEYSRFHIVPSVYRTHLPDALKSHRSHDVVLLCFDCLNEGLRQQHRVKKRLSEQYDAPMEDVSKFHTLNQYILAMKKISNTLLENWERIPQEQKDNLIVKILEMSRFCLEIQNESNDANIELDPK